MEGVDVWAWGKELWVNMQGRYIHFVADYSHRSGATVSICTLGIMGTKYVRDTPVPTELTLNAGETLTLTVEDIYAEIAIANTLIPIVRQATSSALDWVSISSSGNGASEILLDATTLTAGEYKIILESIDANSSVGSVLKTDEIAVTVMIPFIAPSLSTEP